MLKAHAAMNTFFLESRHQLLLAVSLKCLVIFWRYFEKLKRAYDESILFCEMRNDRSRPIKPFQSTLFPVSLCKSNTGKETTAVHKPIRYLILDYSSWHPCDPAPDLFYGKRRTPVGRSVAFSLYKPMFDKLSA